jgi:hypothetical protein
MSDRHFHLKLHSTYETDENKVKDLAIEVLNNGQWEPLDLGIRSPGFLLYINALFSCQHLYMRANSAECGIELDSADGELLVDTDEGWHLKNITVHFDAHIRRGTPTQANLDYINERLYHCPVSSNLPPDVPMKSTVDFS